MKSPLVSVLMITYGHEKYIEQAVTGVLSQKCDFEVELIVANDKSPDYTDSIIQKILTNHPKASNVTYISREKNWGIMPNFIDGLQHCKGKYIALCDGDDYWTDLSKLSKQVRFLEANLDHSMICHNARIIYEGVDKKPALFNKTQADGEISMNAVINKWVIPTASILFRTECIASIPGWFSKIYSADFSLALLLRHSGKIFYSREVMSVYRIAFTGFSMSAVIGKDIEFVGRQHIVLLDAFDAETGGLYSDLVTKRISEINEELKFHRLSQKSQLWASVNMPKTFFNKLLSKVRRVVE